MSLSSTSDPTELKKRNSFLKTEIEKLQKKLQLKEDYYTKWKDLKIKYKELEEKHKK